MIARNRIRCIVVEMRGSEERGRGAIAHDVVPWADPYVAGLIRKLQNEVRQERRQQSRFGGSRISRLGDARLWAALDESDDATFANEN